MSELEFHDVPSLGINLRVGTAGPEGAPVLVLLHGWPESHRAYRSLVPILANDYRLIVPDQRGFGASDKPKGTAAYAMMNLVGDVATLIEWSGADQVGLVGHDFGSAVTWACGGLVANRVRRMVTMCAPHPMRFREASIENPDQIRRGFYVWLMHAGKAGERLLASSDFAMLADWAFGGSVGVTPDLVAAYREDWSRPGAFHAMAEWYRANYPPDLLNPDLEFDLPPIEIPTRYLHAEHDLAVVPEMATGSGKWVDAEFDERIVPGTTHWMLHERPDEVAGLIDDWMRRP